MVEGCWNIKLLKHPEAHVLKYADQTNTNVLYRCCIWHIWLFFGWIYTLRTSGEYVLDPNRQNRKQAVGCRQERRCMKLFSGSQWLWKCGTGVLPLSIFQYSWHLLNIHVTNKAKFGKVSDWANKCSSVQMAKRLLWLLLTPWLIRSVGGSHADGHQRFAHFSEGEPGERATVYQWLHDLFGQDLLQWLVIIHSSDCLKEWWLKFDFLLYTKTYKEDVFHPFVCIWLRM